MKIKIGITIIILFCCTCLHAQTRRLWIDLKPSQSVGLNTWFDNDWLNNAIRNPGTFSIKSSFNVRMSNRLGFFMDISYSWFSYNDKGYKYPQNDPFQIMDFSNKYVIDKFTPLNERYEKKHGGMNGTLGFFYLFNTGKWRILPHVGFGLDAVNSPHYDFTLKEQNSNNMYNVSYKWFNPGEVSRVPIPALSTQVEVLYQVSKRFDLTFGVEFRQALTRASFKAKVSDYYDNSLVKTYSTNGNYMSTLGFSIGISFHN